MYITQQYICKVTRPQISHADVNIFLLFFFSIGQMMDIYKPKHVAGYI